MKIGSIEAGLGEKAFGFLTVTETHGHFPVQAPLHIVQGTQPGPVLLVQAGVSGLEIEPAAVLPQLVKEIDPSTLRGTLLVVPMFNMSGFEFEQINAIWDDKDLSTLGRGNPRGTVSEVLVHTYFNEVISRADAILDVHTGAQWGYEWYAGVYAARGSEHAKALAAALGLPQVLVGQPEDGSSVLEAARDGKMVVSVRLGGGPGLRDFRDEFESRLRNAVLNAMRHLQMIDGPLQADVAQVTVLRLPAVLKQEGPRGFVFMDASKRGQAVAKGEALGIVRHAHTGETLQTITAPKAGVVIHSGAVWPVVPEDAHIAIIAEPYQEIRFGEALQTI